MKNKFHKFSLRTWNVHTMYAAGTMTIRVSALQRYLCEIIAIQKIRWTNVVNMNLRDVTIFYGCGQTHDIYRYTIYM